MTTFINKKKTHYERDLATISKILDTGILQIQKVYEGKNSRVYWLESDHIKPYVAKFYFNGTLDHRERMRIEFNSLRFLELHSIRTIPKAILANPALGCAIYEAVDGDKIQGHRITDSDIDQMINFLSQLKQLRSLPDSEGLPYASEAFLSIKDAVKNIDMRCNRLEALSVNAESKHMLINFLRKDFLPVFREITNRLKRCHAEILWHNRLPRSLQTLSPSDIGFHNALRCKRGDLFFVDFEYFGWDDPAKMISDIILHPAVPLKEQHKRQMVTRLLDVFKDDSELPDRLAVLYPLCGLKWCMIFLNEFIPEFMKRRQFSAHGLYPDEEIKARQLYKSRNMLEKIWNEYEHFPYAQ